MMQTDRHLIFLRSCHGGDRTELWNGILDECVAAVNGNGIWQVLLRCTPELYSSPLTTCMSQEEICVRTSP